MLNRNIKYTFRLNKPESETFRKRVQKSGLSLESYIRHTIFGFVPADKPPPEFYDVMKELHTIGRNMNQVAQKAHVLNVIDAQRYDEAVAQHNKAIVDIMNAVMLPRKIE